MAAALARVAAADYNPAARDVIFVMARGGRPQHPHEECPSRGARLRTAIQCVVLALSCLAVATSSVGAGRPRDAREGPDPDLRKILLSAIQDADSFQDRYDAEVWLVDMSRRLAKQVPDPNERLEILKNVHRHATIANVAPELVLAVIDVESNFDRYAISSASALGLMQVMPFWVPELGYEDKNVLFKIDTNILLGCRILKYYLDMERGDLLKGLARYNGSVGRRVYSDKVMQRWRTKWYRL
jgi:soluble lytic murein transglycosylase-like protein